MKKLLHISFAIFYLVLTTGFTLTVHYCGGEISDVSVARSAEVEDPCGSMCETSCCKDESIIVKLTDYHAPAQSQIIKISDYASEDYSNIFAAQLLSERENFYPLVFIVNSNPPPIYISNCSFLN